MVEDAQIFSIDAVSILVQDEIHSAVGVDPEGCVESFGFA
jgi:hypothetical protein